LEREVFRFCVGSTGIGGGEEVLGGVAWFAGGCS